MAELHFFHGTMNGGKSTLALQVHHTNVSAGKRVLLLTQQGRERGRISSRIGLSQPALEVDPALDLHALVRDRLRAGEVIDMLIVDEAQFLAAHQVDQLATVVDELDVDVQAFGLLTDFTTRLFPGSQRLVELADRRVELQVEARCWCGRRATHNARTIDGVLVRSGDVVVVGDVEGGPDGEVAYEVLCRDHHRAGVTRATADRVLTAGT